MHKQVQKLSINRETVAHLGTATLSRIRGGVIASNGGTCADEMCTTGGTGGSGPSDTYFACTGRGCFTENAGCISWDTEC